MMSSSGDHGPTGLPGIRGPSGPAGDSGLPGKLLCHAQYSLNTSLIYIPVHPDLAFLQKMITLYSLERED